MFVVGEIGQNGINVLILYKSIAKLHEIVPPIVEEITKATMVCDINLKYWNVGFNFWLTIWLSSSRLIIKSILFLFPFIWQTSIEERAVEIVVPGNFSIGCNFGVLTIVNSGNKDDYDQYGCLVAYNTFIEYYNGHLNQAIETLR